MESLIRWFKENGETIQVSSQHPVWIMNPQKVWMIRKGRIDIFAVKTMISSEGVEMSAAGRRIYISSMAPGECIFGLPHDKREEIPDLLAVGNVDTSLIEVDRSAITRMIKNSTSEDEYAQLVSNWVIRLSAGLDADPPPKVYIEPGLKSGTILEAGQMLKPRENVTWVSIEEGGASYLSNDTLRVCKQHGLIPLTNKTWLVTTSEKNRVRSEDTREWLHGTGFNAELKAFHELVLRALSIRNRIKAEAELDKIKTRKEHNRVLGNKALVEFASIIEPGHEESVPMEATSDPLFNACTLVGRAMGIKIVKVPGGRFRAKGTKLSSIANASGTRVRRVILRGKWWRKENGPLLAYLQKGNTPVALLPRNGQTYLLVDPANKRKLTVNREVAGLLTPVAHTFYKAFPDRALTPMDILEFSLRGCRKDFGSILLMGILGGALGMIIPVATGIIFDSIIPGAELDQLFQLTLALIVGALGVTLFQVTRSFAMIRLETRVNMTLEAAIWDRLLKLPAPFFRDYSVGDLTQRAMGISAIREMLTGSTLSTILSSVFSVFNFFLLFYYSWKLALVGSGLILITVSITGLTTFIQLRYQREMMKIMGDISGFVLQVIEGVAKLKIAGAEIRAYYQWAKQFAVNQKLGFKSGMYGNFAGVFNDVFAQVSNMVIFAFVALYLNMQTGKLFPTGDFLALNAAFGQFMASTLILSSTLLGLIKIIPLYERARPIMEAVPEIMAARTDPGELRGEIEVNHVCFRYKPDAPDVLKDVSIKASPGEFIALVGPSGSGKSSLLRLLMAFEKAESGSIYFDGQNIDDIDLRLFRNQLGVVLQNGRIMSGSLVYNIIGASQLTIDDAWEAARMAGLDKDIENMPMGMQTCLMEGAGTLSGGQRQRMMIARALVHKPRILFFDEATSALDNITQAQVSKSLEQLDATRIVVAHRLTTIMNADRIYMIVAGEVKQVGTYQELINREGPFADLVKRQIA